MTPAQVLIAINAAVGLTGAGGFTGAGGTVGGGSADHRPGRGPQRRRRGHGRHDLLATDTAAQVATKINAALDAVGGGDWRYLGLRLLGGQLVVSSSLDGTIADARAATTRRLTAHRPRWPATASPPPARCRPACWLPRCQRTISRARERQFRHADQIVRLGAVPADRARPGGRHRQSHQPADPKRGRAGADDDIQGRRQSDADGHVRHRRRRGVHHRRIADRARHADRRHRERERHQRQHHDQAPTASPTRSRSAARRRRPISASTRRRRFRRTSRCSASTSTTFINQTLGGGAITCYDMSGAPVNMQLRWGKVDSSSLGTGHSRHLEPVLSGRRQRHRHAGRLAERRRQLHASMPTAR